MQKWCTRNGCIMLQVTWHIKTNQSYQFYSRVVTLFVYDTRVKHIWDRNLEKSHFRRDWDFCTYQKFPDIKTGDEGLVTLRTLGINSLASVQDWPNCGLTEWGFLQPSLKTLLCRLTKWQLTWFFWSMHFEFFYISSELTCLDLQNVLNYF